MLFVEKKNRKICYGFQTLSEDYYDEAKQLLIQCFPIVKFEGVFVLNINCLNSVNDTNQ